MRSLYVSRSERSCSQVRWVRRVKGLAMGTSRFLEVLVEAPLEAAAASEAQTFLCVFQSAFCQSRLQ